MERGGEGKKRNASQLWKHNLPKFYFDRMMAKKKAIPSALSAFQTEKKEHFFSPNKWRRRRQQRQRVLDKWKNKIGDSISNNWPNAITKRWHRIDISNEMNPLNTNWVWCVHYPSTCVFTFFDEHANFKVIASSGEMSAVNSLSLLLLFFLSYSFFVRLSPLTRAPRCDGGANGEWYGANGERYKRYKRASSSFIAVK